MNAAHVDVLIIGAGISGIGAAYHLQKHCPGKSYSLIEARAAVGGTWDLFRYPGIRSDSDMFTFGFKFKPWKSPKAISPGEDIREYITEAAFENGIDRHIEFEQRVIAANWCSDAALWTARIKNLTTGDIREVTSNFIFSCGGYYNYEKGHTPQFKGSESFEGEIVHPQHWPEQLDYADKKVVVIGSGATAVTLVPTLAKTAAHVTMLQRSPTYIVSRPEQDTFANAMRRYLPAKLAYSLSRWKSVLMGMFTYTLAKRKPERVKQAIVNGVRAFLGDDYDVDTHFTPDYKPWDQRICLVPNGDLFRSIRSGAASVVTDHIDSFTATGISLRSGVQIDADVIVTATGLNAELFSGLRLSVDNQLVNLADRYCYKGMMLNGMPNFAFSMGYTNASWTLKSDLVAEYVCRLINHMAVNGYASCSPVVPAEGIEQESMMDFTSGYVTRALEKMPKQGKTKPWKLYQNYILDRLSLGRGSLADSSMVFLQHGHTAAAVAPESDEVCAPSA